GLSGKDAGMITCTPTNASLGFVGTPDKVHRDGECAASKNRFGLLSSGVRQSLARPGNPAQHAM
ncbi:MAG: hypothetical protein AAF399_11330, partial [Bacteroidota bacterium]